ncbi:hypothetical protein [Streptomyces collinus]|uniref:hypothetical protein n=1 Tax=Streptomyces collinus TaxID=42684 RepID=UPI00367A7CED
MNNPALLRSLVDQYEALAALHAENGAAEAEQRMYDASSRCACPWTRTMWTVPWWQPGGGWVSPSTCSTGRGRLCTGDRVRVASLAVRVMGGEAGRRVFRRLPAPDAALVRIQRAQAPASEPGDLTDLRRPDNVVKVVIQANIITTWLRMCGSCARCNYLVV